MLDDVVAFLRCPHCPHGLSRDGGVLCCAAGHRFDIARQGYVSLLGRREPAGSGDTAAMVVAREAFLDAGHYAPLAEAVLAAGDRLGRVGPTVTVDVGAGTGYYLRQVLDRRDGIGLALDLSRHAARKAARAHSRIGAVACDVWAALPVRSGVATVVLSIFAPRNGAEIRRILRADGAAVVVTPTDRHLTELVDRLELLHVDARKDERVRAQLGPHLAEVDRRGVEVQLELGRAAVMDLVAMGPSAWHTTREAIGAKAAALPDPVRVTASFTVSVYRPRRQTWA